MTPQVMHDPANTPGHARVPNSISPATPAPTASHGTPSVGAMVAMPTSGPRMWCSSQTPTAPASA